MQKKISIIVFVLFIGIVFVASFLFYKKNIAKEQVEEPQEEIVEQEPQNSNSYIKIKDASLESNDADTSILVKFETALFGLAKNDVVIQGDSYSDFGTIDKLTDTQNIPIHHLETNNKTYYQGKIVRASYYEIVIQKNNKVYLFKRISK